MICSECLKLGLKSRVYVGRGTTTLIYSAPFYDEDGKYHNHNPNINTTEYSCSNGHKWVEHSKSHCWCEVQNDFSTKA